MAVKAEVMGNLAVLENEYIQLTIDVGKGYVTESIAAKQNGWRPVLTGTRRNKGDGGKQFVPLGTKVKLIRRTPEEGVIRVEGVEGSIHFTTEIALCRGEHYLQYRVRADFPEPVWLRSLQSTYVFCEPRVDFCFAPHLRPHEDDVIGQFAFKSPTVIVQKGATLAAIIADVKQIDGHNQIPLCLDVDVAPETTERPQLGYGFKTHEPYGLIYFRHRADMKQNVIGRGLEYGYYVYVSAQAEERYGYREITRTLWRLFGAAHARSSSPQVVPFDRYADYGLGHARENLWRELPMKDGKACGGFVMGIKFPSDIWFHFFFNHLQTAYGLYLMGARIKNDDLIEKAKKICNLVLAAPVRDGLVPAIFSHQIVTGIREDRWITQAHWVGGSIPYQTQIARPIDMPIYNAMDSSWTCYWMLRWYADLERRPELLQVARAHGEQLLRLQLKSGAIPVFIDANTLEPEDRLRENASCSVCGMFLIALYEATRDQRYLRAAEKVADFLRDRVMPQGWADYETYYDSAGKSMDLFDRHTQQLPQDTYSIYWASQLCKGLFHATKKAEYLEQAKRILDYLLLFQAVWSPPYLSVKLFGAIGVGNGHTGWGDFRSSIFAPGIIDFYFATGLTEYLERGIAAMRHPLPLMFIPENKKVSAIYADGPVGRGDENYAHRGRDARLGPSCMDSSVGYPLVAFNELWDRLGSVYIDMDRIQGFGVDGVSVKSVKRSGGKLDLRIEDEVSRRRVVKVCFGRAPRGPLTISINGKSPKTYRGAELRKGIQVEI